jgi:hypothetical protein
VTAEPITEIASPLLQELVNWGITAFRRCEVEAAQWAADKKTEPNEDAAALLLYRHIIEMVDGIEVLVVRSCGTAAIPLVRSEFEASISLSYILSDDAAYVQRSLSWLVSEVHAGIKEGRTLEPGTPSGQQYAQRYADEFGRVIPSTPNAGIAAEIQKKEQALQGAQLAPIEAEYQRMKKGERVPEWFSLFGGPRNRRELAEQLGRGTEYQLLYGDWSGLGHANEVHRYLSIEKGQQMHEPVRRPTELKQISLFAAVWLLRASRQMVDKFRRDENMTPWYEREVKALFHKLRQLDVKFNTL